MTLNIEGPPARIQALRLKGKLTREERQEIREWLKHYRKTSNARPETIEAYSV